MTEIINLDTAVQGLMNYRQAIGSIGTGAELVVGTGEHAISLEAAGALAPELGQPEAGMRSAIANAQTNIDGIMRRHARVAYCNNLVGHGLEYQDMRTDSPEERIQRADILALVSAPPDQDIRRERADKIHVFLERLAAGDRIVVPGMPFDNVPSIDQQVVTADTSRPLFGMFDAHFIAKVLHIQYDTSRIYNEDPLKGIMQVDLDLLFSSPTGDFIYDEPEAV